eukprot:GEMP01053107.1.p1 GENE.GEMP01053107.1~~GEMP01053107.1.p1  ORF type:complete len:235 (+),score=45.79 GEMP01053107.1:69-773(+)
MDKLVFNPPPCSYGADSFPEVLAWIPRLPPNSIDDDACVWPRMTQQNSIPVCLLQHKEGVHVLVYFHANAEDLGASHQHVLSLQVWLKVHAVCVEYPGYGLSVGTPTEKTVRDDSCSVIRFLIKVMGVPVSRIVLMGRSIGSAVAAKLAKDFDVGGLILISPFTRIVDVAEQMVGRLSSAIFDDTFFDTLSIMSEIHCRTLFFHGMLLNSECANVGRKISSHRYGTRKSCMRIA